MFIAYNYKLVEDDEDLHVPSQRSRQKSASGDVLLVFWEVCSAGAANERQKEISDDFPTDFTGKRLKSKVAACSRAGGQSPKHRLWRSLSRQSSELPATSAGLLFRGIRIARTACKPDTKKLVWVRLRSPLGSFRRATPRQLGALYRALFSASAF
jgi:hypothetical protein